MEDIQDLYTKNSETQLREVKDLNKWKYNTILIGCLNSVQMTSLPKDLQIRCNSI